VLRRARLRLKLPAPLARGNRKTDSGLLSVSFLPFRTAQARTPNAGALLAAGNSPPRLGGAGASRCVIEPEAGTLPSCRFGSKFFPEAGASKVGTPGDRDRGGNRWGVDTARGRGALRSRNRPEKETQGRSLTISKSRTSTGATTCSGDTRPKSAGDTRPKRGSRAPHTMGEGCAPSMSPAWSG
jgi:hypothetical protein